MQLIFTVNGTSQLVCIFCSEYFLTLKVTTQACYTMSIPMPWSTLTVAITSTSSYRVRYCNQNDFLCFFLTIIQLSQLVRMITTLPALLNNSIMTTPTHPFHQLLPPLIPIKDLSVGPFLFTVLILLRQRIKHRWNHCEAHNGSIHCSIFSKWSIDCRNYSRGHLQSLLRNTWYDFTALIWSQSTRHI